MEFEKLRSIIVEVLNVDEDEITMNTTFVDDLGADSLDVFQIITGIEDEFDIEIPQEKQRRSYPWVMRWNRLKTRLADSGCTEKPPKCGAFLSVWTGKRGRV